MSNTINWFQSQRLYALLTKVSLDKENAYYGGKGKLTPQEEQEMSEFLKRYEDKSYTPAGANA